MPANLNVSTVEDTIKAEQMFPAYLLKKLRYRLTEDDYNTTRDNIIVTYTPNEAFAAILEFDGLRGWDYTLKGYIKEIYGIDLDDIHHKLT